MWTFLVVYSITSMMRAIIGGKLREKLLRPPLSTGKITYKKQYCIPAQVDVTLKDLKDVCIWFLSLAFANVGKLCQVIGDYCK